MSGECCMVNGGKVVYYLPFTIYHSTNEEHLNARSTRYG
jgi:hypothetical protein